MNHAQVLSGMAKKIGVVALLMACLAMAGWVRSLSIEDTLNVAVGNHMYHEFHSTRNGVMWILTWDSTSGHQEEMPDGVMFIHKVRTKPLGWQIFVTRSRYSWISTPVSLLNNDGDLFDYDYAKTSPAPI